MDITEIAQQREQQHQARRVASEKRRRGTVLAWTNSQDFVVARLADLMAPIPTVSVDSHNDAYQELLAVVGPNLERLLESFAGEVIKLAYTGELDNGRREQEPTGSQS